MASPPAVASSSRTQLGRRTTTLIRLTAAEATELLTADWRPYLTTDGNIMFYQRPVTQDAEELDSENGEC